MRNELWFCQIRTLKLIVIIPSVVDQCQVEVGKTSRSMARSMPAECDMNYKYELPSIMSDSSGVWLIHV